MDQAASYEDVPAPSESTVSIWKGHQSGSEWATNRGERGELASRMAARAQRVGLGARVHRASHDVLWWVAGHEIWITLAIIPFLIFPNPGSAIALGTIPCLWLLRWMERGHVTTRTPVDNAVLVVMFMILVGLYATAVPSLTWVAVCQIIAGVALFYALVNGLRRSEHLQRAAHALAFLGGALALVGLLSTPWIKGKLALLPQAYRDLLLLETINANVLAGVLVMLIPFATALLLYREGRHSLSRRAWLVRTSPLLALVAMLPVLIVTQSRGAYPAVVVALLIVALPRFRWLLISLPIALFALLIALHRMGVERIMDLLLTTDALGAWERRLELWSRAVYMIQDFPYTGIGLGTFGRVAPVLYPYFLRGPDADVPHAHNLFLQVAVDLGIPGLVALLALLTGTLMMAWRAYLASRSKGEYDAMGIALGLFAGLVGMIIHGMVDAVTWGTKPSIIPWVFMALAVVACRLAIGPGGLPEVPNTKEAGIGRKEG